eukprot:NODE_718_length_1239_cov_13.667266_g678_i0.p1 GENE.NODE_718_length_1239_cov_13.667266_g678_i0~~NODE_718_length_1239_cov_13.667266_g678_i0.p1  ORF type:complete len:336 (+),score=48.87 NODE_718_length_1239_cov_13.667266_g678_i0:187-1194(+)
MPSSPAGGPLPPIGSPNAVSPKTTTVTDPKADAKGDNKPKQLKELQEGDAANTREEEYNQHFFCPSPPSRAPWQQELDVRWASSLDPRARQRCSDAHAFEGTQLQELFEFFQSWAGSVMEKGIVLWSPAGFANFLRPLGICSEFSLHRIFKVFDWRKVNAINLMDFMHILKRILTGEHADEIIHACFDTFDLDCDRLIRRRIMETYPRKNPRGITEGQLNALVAIFNKDAEAEDPKLADSTMMTFDEFKDFFMTDGHLLLVCLNILLEAIGAVYHERAPPKPPPRDDYVADGDEHSYWDPDGVLLEQIQQLGYDPLAQLKHPKKKKKGKKKGGKK